MPKLAKLQSEIETIIESATELTDLIDEYESTTDTHDAADVKYSIIDTLERLIGEASNLPALLKALRA